MRTTIRQECDEVVLRYVDALLGEKVVIRFWAPPGGGYVRQVTRDRPGALGDQVCIGLSRRGPTLVVASRDQLLPLIRREWRRLRAAERNAF